MPGSVESTDRSDEEIVGGYLACLSDGGGGQHHWAFEDMIDMISKDPERAWRLTLEMIRQTNDDLLLATVAAGPLEDLLCYHGPTFIERVETQALSDPHFLKCLRSVWGHTRMPPEVYARVRKVADRDA